MNKAIHTVSFMTLITIVFIAVLAFLNESSKERITQNLQVEIAKSILYAFDILPENVKEENLDLTSTTNDIPWDEQQLIEYIRDNIKKIKLPLIENQRELLKNSYLFWRDSVEVYVHLKKNREILAYGFTLRGKGLWGTITAVGAISADLKKMIGIDFIEQVETPGLGARILETEFKYFFRNLNLNKLHDSKVMENAFVLVKKKNKTNVEESTNTLQAITGATQTVNGVLNMINLDLRFYSEVIQKNKELIKRLLREL